MCSSRKLRSVAYALSWISFQITLPISISGLSIRDPRVLRHIGIGISGEMGKSRGSHRITGNPFLAAQPGNLTRQPISITTTVFIQNSPILIGEIQQLRKPCSTLPDGGIDAE